MAIYARTGNIIATRVPAGPQRWRARFAWTTDSDGEAVLIVPFPISGTLIRYSAQCPEQDPVYDGDYLVCLYDEWGVDQFDGLVAGLDPSGYSDDGSLYVDLDGSDRRRPLVVVGELTLRVSRSAHAPQSMNGVFDLWWNEMIDQPDARPTH